MAQRPSSWERETRRNPDRIQNPRRGNLIRDRGNWPEHQSGKGQLPPGATSMRLASGKQYDLRVLLKAILDQIKSSLDDLDRPSKIMNEWWRNCIHRPLRVQVTFPKDTVTGISRAIDEHGSLLIETDDHEIRRVNGGSLRILND